LAVRLERVTKRADTRRVPRLSVLLVAAMILGCGPVASGTRRPGTYAGAEVPLPVRALRVRVLEDMAFVAEAETNPKLNDRVKAAVQAELGRAGLTVVQGQNTIFDFDLRIELRASGAVRLLRGHVGLVAESGGVAVALADSGEELRSEAEFPIVMAQKAVGALLQSPALAEFAERRRPPTAAKRAEDAKRNPEAVARARAHYNKGTRQYDLGRFGEALAEFESAYLVVPDPVFLFNSAQCHRKLGNDEQALSFYRSYLRNAPDAPNRSEVVKRIQDLEARESKKK
jgi:tetratricopeptide (TPR) repeat protein